MTCDKTLLVQAYFDGEIDAGQALDIEEHLKSCPTCPDLLAEDRRLRAALRTTLPYHRATDRLVEAIAGRSKTHKPSPLHGAFGRAGARRGFVSGVFGGAASTLAAAMLAFFLIAPGTSDLVVEDVTTAHMRSLMANHLIDVASSDRHTVKPWFNGRVDVSPPVADFSAEGFVLVGGRLDYVNRRAVAAVVYQRGHHIINLFSWPDGGKPLPLAVTHNGYHLLFWRSGDLVFCAVSDVAPADLAELAALVKGETPSQGRE